MNFILGFPTLPFEAWSHRLGRKPLHQCREIDLGRAFRNGIRAPFLYRSTSRPTRLLNGIFERTPGSVRNLENAADA